MQLEDFISQTLVQIAKGIERANQELKDSLAKVNPPNVHVYDSDRGRHVYGHLNEAHEVFEKPRVHAVQFDVAIYAGEGKETKGGIGVVVGAIALGSQGKSDAAQSTTSRIQFMVPVYLPTSDPVKIVKPPGF